PAYFTAYSYDVIATSDGGYAITGNVNNGNNTDCYLIKTDGNGIKQWAHAYGGSAQDYAYALQQTNDGGFVIAGQTYGLGQNLYEVYVIRTDAIGSVVWTKTYGGSRLEVAFDIVTSNDGGFVITGKTSGFGTGQIYDDDL